MCSQLAVWIVNELKGHLFLGRSADTRTQKVSRYKDTGRDHMGHQKRATLILMAPLTSSSSHPYKSQCRTTRARCRFQISRNTVAAVSTGKCHSTPRPGWLKSSGWLALGPSRDAQQQLTPQSHEDGKQHSAIVVKEMSELRAGAKGLHAVPPNHVPQWEGRVWLFRASRCLVFPTSRWTYCTNPCISPGKIPVASNLRKSAQF